ncbi:DNA-3-methyladenine glycosylase I [Paraburkholderia tropica]|uniref:DNA-3-methyladenine glycosylase I n=1 Tax=Paraburkholderia tropica TaxID=92647 RepID=A0AAQ1JTH0_9BURK|nr:MULTISPECIES: DNA-3-methyladenine glycosylase I [Paraburkholderia]SEJ48120.1 DNA-3-methyladenine glycosylase I [Paraburkholderia tropica]
MTHRCNWVTSDALAQYHDEEWGVPSRDDQHLYEMLILEGAQAGLSWSTILNKREGYRRAFAGFDVDKVARFTPKHVETLMQDASIVRNRAKIESAILNARAVQQIRAEHGSLAQFIWSFVDDTPIQNDLASYRDAPTSTDVSDALSKALKKYGCKFIGTTICYAFMQAVGMVNDHERDCCCRDACAALGGVKSKAKAKSKTTPAKSRAQAGT